MRFRVNQKVKIVSGYFRGEVATVTEVLLFADMYRVDNKFLYYRWELEAIKQDGELKQSGE